LSPQGRCAIRRRPSDGASNGCNRRSG
jgi:hypothetical protein